MCPPRGLLLVTILVLLNHLDHLSLARNLPTPTPSPGMFQCLNHSQTLLRAISNTLQKARQTLEFYSCTSEEIDHEDITKDKTSTVEACLPLELTMNESCLASREISLITNGSCLASRKTSFMTTLCLSSIYEDLKMYQVEFKAMNAKLLMDPKRQIFLDQNMLTAIDELLQESTSQLEQTGSKSSSRLQGRAGGPQDLRKNLRTPCSKINPRASVLISGAYRALIVNTQTSGCGLEKTQSQQ
uniref:Interleukin-12 subunit alpha n=1 Tax=Felis catus TaxID=9685 RepID=A0ABI7WWF1_FELCA